MQSNKTYFVPNRTGPHRPVIFYPDICTGCNTCVDVCPQDILMPNPEKGKPPVMVYPDECWYGGGCVDQCPVAGAIELNHPMLRRVRWKRKETGEHFRL